VGRGLLHARSPWKAICARRAGLAGSNGTASQHAMEPPLDPGAGLPPCTKPARARESGPQKSLSRRCPFAQHFA
jgi:hypothetical protein